MILLNHIEKGGIYYELEGSSPKDALASLISALPPQKNVSPAGLLHAVLERETLMPTAIGDGIAIPHPRNPLILNQDEEFIAMGFLKNPQNWNSLDGIPVDTLFLIVSSSAKSHLGILSRISFLCQDEEFRNILKNRPPASVILGSIKSIEENWK